MLRINVFVTCAVLMASLAGCQKKMPEMERRLRIRLAQTDPAEVSRNVASWSLQINGVPFDQHPVLTIGQVCEMTGHVEIQPGIVSRDATPTLIVALRPVGRQENKDWMALGSPDFHRELEAVIESHKKRLQPGGPVIREKDFPPGEYNARAYLRIWDFLNGHPVPVLLGKSTMTVQPAAPAGEDARQGSRTVPTQPR